MGLSTGAFSLKRILAGFGWGGVGVGAGGGRSHTRGTAQHAHVTRRFNGSNQDRNKPQNDKAVSPRRPRAGRSGGLEGGGGWGGLFGDEDKRVVLPGLKRGGTVGIQA